MAGIAVSRIAVTRRSHLTSPCFRKRACGSFTYAGGPYLPQQKCRMRRVQRIAELRLPTRQLKVKRVTRVAADGDQHLRPAARPRTQSRSRRTQTERDPEPRLARHRAACEGRDR